MFSKNTLISAASVAFRLHQALFQDCINNNWYPPFGPKSRLFKFKDNFYKPKTKGFISFFLSLVENVSKQK